MFLELNAENLQMFESNFVYPYSKEFAKNKKIQ